MCSLKAEGVCPMLIWHRKDFFKLQSSHLGHWKLSVREGLFPPNFEHNFRNSSSCSPSPSSTSKSIISGRQDHLNISGQILFKFWKYSMASSSSTLYILFCIEDSPFNLKTNIKMNKRIYTVVCDYKLKLPILWCYLILRRAHYKMFN